MSDSPSPDLTVNVALLTDMLRGIFVHQGVSDAGAAITSESLVAAEMDGVSSHGVALVPLYVERLKAGGVLPEGTPTVMQDLGGLVLMSAGHSLGQISAQAAVDLAVARARIHGVSLVVVRHCFHFGTAGFWAARIARAGMVGMAFSNTRPLMPAPGGAERIVGNNPIAIAFPSATEDPLLLDMAMSATAMGNVRLAASRNEPIPEGWAVDEAGNATTSAKDAIGGMLLPAAGPKGFALAVAVDLLCGGLSGGATGSQVRPLYGDASEHYNCSHAFLAIDASRVGDGAGIGDVVTAVADRIRQSKRAPGVHQIFSPGDIERARRRTRSPLCPLPAPLIAQLDALASEAGLPVRLSLDSVRNSPGAL